MIAPSFADIFKNNALGNGLLTVELTEAEVNRLMTLLEEKPGTKVTVDLEAMTVEAPGFSRELHARPLPPLHAFERPGRDRPHDAERSCRDRRL